MPLVKKNAIGNRAGAVGKGKSPAPGKPLVKDAPDGQRPAPIIKKAMSQTAAERIGAATHELASGVAEAAGAAEELRRSLNQIAAAAEEAARTSDTSLRAITLL